MRRGRVEFVHRGDNFSIGRTRRGYGIWPNAVAGRRRPGDPIRSFPLSDAGWAAAWAQLHAWETAARPQQPPTAGAGQAHRWGGAGEAAQAIPGVDRDPQETATPWNARRWWAVAAAATVVFVAAGLGVYLPGSSNPVVRTASSQPADAGAGSPPNTGGDTNNAAGQAGPDNTRTPSPPAVGTGYLATGETFVDYIQWTDTAGRLNGTAQAINVDGSPPNEQTHSHSIPLTGTVNGSSIAISFDGDAQTFGTITAGEFTLNFPQSDGSLAPITFTTEPASAFNQALSQLQQQVATANQAEATAEAVAAAQHQIDADAKAVAAIIASTLPQDEKDLTDSAQQVAGADGQTDAALATTKQDEQKTASEAAQGGNQGGTCTDAGGVATDAGGVATEAGGVETEAGGVASYQSATQSDTTKLNAAFGQYQADQADLPGYTPANPPTQDQVTSAANQAAAAIAAAVAAANSGIDHANADVDTAYGYAVQAYQAGHCGPPPHEPQPEPHIS